MHRFRAELRRRKKEEGFVYELSMLDWKETDIRHLKIELSKEN